MLRAPSIPLSGCLLRLPHPWLRPLSRVPSSKAQVFPAAPSDPRTQGEVCLSHKLGEGLGAEESPQNPASIRGREWTVTFLPSPVSIGTGGPRCGPGSSWATLRRRLRLAGPALPSLRLQARATRPVPSGPPHSDFTPLRFPPRKCLLSPARGRGGRGGRAGGGVHEARPHKAQLGSGRTPGQRGGDSPKESREGKEGRGDRGSVGSGSASEPRTSNPGQADGRVLVYFHFILHYFLHQVQSSRTSPTPGRPPPPLLGRNQWPLFPSPSDGTRTLPPAPPPPHFPPITTHRPTSEK